MFAITDKNTEKKKNETVQTPKADIQSVSSTVKEADPSFLLEDLPSAETRANQPLGIRLFEALMVGDSKKQGCPQCQTTYADVLQSGAVGCPNCYIAFSDTLAPLFNLIGDCHCKYIPTEVKKKRQRQKELERLTGELASAVKAEDFERAAMLRDKIHALQSGGI